MAEDKQKRQKEESTQKMQSPYSRTSDRYNPGYTVGRKFPLYLPEIPSSYPHGVDAFNKAGDGYGQNSTGFLAIQNHHNKGN